MFFIRFQKSGSKIIEERSQKFSRKIFYDQLTHTFTVSWLLFLDVLNSNIVLMIAQIMLSSKLVTVNECKNLYQNMKESHDLYSFLNFRLLC